MARRQSSSRPADRHRSRHGESSRRNEHRKERARRSRPATSSDESRGSQTLSADALARLERENARQKRKAEKTKKAKGGIYKEVNQEPRHERARERARERTRSRDEHRPPERPKTKEKKKKGRRVVSGAIMEEGRAKSGLRGGRGDEWRWSDQSYEKVDYYRKHKPKKSRKKLWIILGAVSVVILIIIIVVAVVVSQKNKKGGSDSNLDGKDRSEIPNKWRSTYLDPWTWKTTSGFNTTFTDEMVGDLPVMGLYSDWDDSTKANDKVPALNEDWGSYSKRPARGVNLGGWLSLEPFIVPSMFDYPASMGIIDEWTLCEHLGSDASKTLEDHYANFVSEDDFKAIADAGLDHVRIPYSYWAVEVYDGDPYIFRTSWRYLLRAIEWARKYGLRVNLDLHGLPGSQNGWNHSGRAGTIGWLNGTDGSMNGDRAHDIHDRLSKFFAQDRYKNVISHYGLANEPRMVELKSSEVISWTEKAYKIIRDNGVKAIAVFGDGFMGLENWQGVMTGYDDMALDVHQYVIFNDDLIAFTHKKKVDFACKDWTEQSQQSMDTSTGYGPTLFAEWSQADTDCQPLVNGGVDGARWDGTHNSNKKPGCPAGDDSCSCTDALGDPSSFSKEYKKFLTMFAEAQMHSFEKGWGWWYWTWKTENAPLWSYQAGLKAGLLPEKAYSRGFNCDSTVPDFGDEGLSEDY